MVGDGNGNPVRACVKGGTASIEKKKASPPRDTNHKMATGVVAANDHEQMSSEGGTASIEKKKKASPPRDTNHKMFVAPACLLRTPTNRCAQKAELRAAMQGQRTDRSG
jgi:hypothetical protein